MSIVAPWMQRYLFGVQTSGIGSTVTFNSGVEAEVVGKPLLKVTNAPVDLDPNLGFIDQEKATGQSTRHTGASGNSEYQIGAQTPTASPEMDATPNILKLLLWLFFQKGASEAGASPYVATYVPYTTADAEVWATLVDMLSDSAAGENQAIHGAVVRSLTLSGDMSSQSIKLAFELVGYQHVTTLDLSSAVTSDPNIAPLLFKNMDFKINTNTPNISGFTFTMTNGVFSPVYHQDRPYKHVFNKLLVTGEFTLPRDSGVAGEDNNQQIDDFKALTDKTFTFYWGATPAASNGDVSFIFNGIKTSFPARTADEELGSTVAFSNADDDTNDISITVADGIDRGIP